MLPFTARLGHPFCIPSRHREPHRGLGSAGFRSPLCRERPCAGSTARSRSRPVPVPAPVPLPGPFPFPPRLPAQPGAAAPSAARPGPAAGVTRGAAPAVPGPCCFLGEIRGSGAGCRCAGCAFAAIRACGARRCKNAVCLELLSRGRAKDLCAL